MFTTRPFIPLWLVIAFMIFVLGVLVYIFISLMIRNKKEREKNGSAQKPVVTEKAKEIISFYQKQRCTVYRIIKSNLRNVSSRDFMIVTPERKRYLVNNTKEKRKISPDGKTSVQIIKTEDLYKKISSYKRKYVFVREL